MFGNMGAGGWGVGLGKFESIKPSDAKGLG